MASADDPVASEALAGLLRALGRDRGILFETGLLGEIEFGPTAASGGLAQLAGRPRFGPDSLLPRWLLVNRQSLRVPDDIGVFDALPADEQSALESVAATAVVPLVANDQLIAWASISDSATQNPLSERLPESVSAVAKRLMTAREVARERARADGVARTNKLSLTGQMAAGIAHEVRNPLAVVRSLVQSVRKGAIPQAEQGQVLDNIVVEIDRVSDVVTNLMLLARGSAPRDEAIELMALVGDAVEFCRAYARQRRQTIEMTFTGRLWARGDAHELRQVMVNLLLNACQASHEAQTVVVYGEAETTPAGDSVAIVRVVDHGEGMGPRVLARVFDPFFSTKADGGGLGLSLCRDVVRRCGGSIVIESQLGVGTSVILTLPK